MKKIFLFSSLLFFLPSISKADETDSVSTATKALSDMQSVIASSSSENKDNNDETTETSTSTQETKETSKKTMDSSTKSTTESSSQETTTAKKDKESKSVKKIDQVVKKTGRTISRASGEIDLSDWDWEYDKTTRNTIILKSYTGTKTDVTISSYARLTDNSQGYPVDKQYHVLISPNIFSKFKKLTSIEFVPSGLTVGNLKVGVNGTSVRGLLQDQPKLKTVSGLQYLDTRNVENFSYIFAGDKALETIDFDLNVDSGQYFDSMFENCSSLYQVNNLEKGNFSNAKSMQNMFHLCKKLTNIHLHHLPDGVNFYQITTGTPIVYAELLFNSNTAKATNINEMFRHQFGSAFLPLLVYSNSPSFVSAKGGDNAFGYRDYANQGRVLPYIASAGQGVFEQDKYPSFFDIGLSVDWKEEKIPMIPGTKNGFGTNIKPDVIYNPLTYDQVDSKYFSISNPTPTLQGSKSYIVDKSKFYNEYFVDETNNRITHNGYNWTDILKTAPAYVKTIFTRYAAQYAPVNPEAPADHSVNSLHPNGNWPDNRMPAGKVGIAYQPTSLSTGSVKLKDQDTAQEFQLKGETGQKDFHVGVRNYPVPSKKSSWSLSAKLSWNKAPSSDAYITTSGGKITNNTNNDNNTKNAPIPFKSGQLANYTGSAVTKTGDSLTLKPNQSVTILKANGKEKSAFYDYDLGTMKLVLPNPNKADIGDFSGNINWNLTSAPMGR